MAYISIFFVELTGSPDSPHEGVIYLVDIHIPDRYPIVCPIPRFKTYIYHPNVDLQGKICLDLLKPPPLVTLY
jgi:ubiquitin-conjugating enzyme E2 T